MAEPNRILLAWMRGQREKEDLDLQQFNKDFRLREQTERERAQKESERQTDQRIKQTEAYQKQQLDMQQKRDKLQLDQDLFNRRMTIGQGITSGSIKPNTWTPDMAQLFSSLEPDAQTGMYPTVAQNAFDPGDGRGAVDVSGFATPAQKGQATLELQRPTLEAKSREQQGVLDYKQGQALALENVRQTGREKVANINKDAKTEAAKIAADRAERLAHIRGSYTLGSAKLKAAASKRAANSDEGEEIEALANAAALGRVDLATSKLANKARVVLQSQGFAEMKKKKAEALDNFGNFENIMTDIDEFIKKHGTNSALGRLYNKVAGKTTLTDIGSDYKSLVSRAGQIAEVISGEPGRKTEGDIQRAMGAVGDPGQTVANLKKNREKVRRDIGTIIVGKALAGIPEKQKLHVAANYNIPIEFLGEVAVKGKSYPKYKQQEDGQITVLNPTKGIYEEVEP